MDMKLELVPVPVSDVDRAKAFYTEKLGSPWRSTGRWLGWGASYS